MTNRIFKLTMWLSLVAILGSLFIQTRGLTNRQVQVFFTGLFILSATFWIQTWKRIDFKQVVPGSVHQFEREFVWWRWWGTLIAILGAILMTLPILDLIIPQYLPAGVNGFFQTT